MLQHGGPSTDAMTCNLPSAKNTSLKVDKNMIKTFFREAFSAWLLIQGWWYS